jgi:predicted transcriptional regulator
MEKLSTTSLKLDPGIKKRVPQLASARRRGPHWVMREAIEDYVERQEKREQLRQDVLAAWAPYEATGLNVTDEEAHEWLAKLEAGKKAAPPKCHARGGANPRCAMSIVSTTFWLSSVPTLASAPQRSSAEACECLAVTRSSAAR